MEFAMHFANLPSLQCVSIFLTDLWLKDSWLGKLWKSLGKKSNHILKSINQWELEKYIFIKVVHFAEKAMAPHSSTPMNRGAW